MEKFRYRKQDQSLQDGCTMQMHHGQPYQQQDYHVYNHEQQDCHIFDHEQPDYSYDQRAKKQQFDRGQRPQHHQQFYNDQKQHQYEHGHRQQFQQQLQQQQHYVPELRQHKDTHEEKKLKQHTDWNGVLQDLFGMDLPLTAESTHESTSSGVASDVTSIYQPTPILTTFKGGDSAGSASSAKSTESRDSGTKSASVSGSPRPGPFQKPYPRGTRTSHAVPLPAIPKDTPPLLGKNIHCLAGQSSPNGYHQVNAYCASPTVVTKDKKQPRDRGLRQEPNCIQCSNNINNRAYIHQRNTDISPNLCDCRAVDPAFCCDVDQCCVEDMRDEQFTETFGDNRYRESHIQENFAPRERQHAVSPPMYHTSSPHYCCNQQSRHINNEHLPQSEMSSRNMKSWYKQQQLQHYFQQQQQQHPQNNRHSPATNDSSLSSPFDICNHHNHQNIPSSQTRMKELSSSQNLQKFTANNTSKTSRMPCHHQINKMALQSKSTSEQQSENVIHRAQTPRGPQMLLTHAQIHTPQLETRSRYENKIKSTYTQPESHVNNASNKQQLAREADLLPNLMTGINNLSLCQKDNHKGKITLMSSSGKRSASKLAPFEFLPNCVLLKIFSHLPTDHLCKCAQVCRHWYNVVWDHPILWTSIVINNQGIDIDRALKYLTRRLSYNTPKVCMILEKININTCCRLSDHGLQTVAKRCPELRYLDMQNCHLITNVGVKEAVSRCVNLERLDVTGCPLVTCISLMDSLISQSASRHLQLIYLRYLDMTDCPNVTDEDLSIITSQCTQLLFFYLRRCSFVTDLGVTYIANNCSSLRELSLSDCKNITDLGIRQLAKLRENLRYLSVAKCEKVSDQGIIHIARYCSKLRYLNVRGCEAFSDAGLEFVAQNCPRLRSLDIGKCDITDEGLYALSMYCPNLRKLGVKSCDAITDKGIVLIAYKCPSLQQLHVQDCCISPDACAMVRKYCKKAIIEHTNPAIL